MLSLPHFPIKSHTIGKVDVTGMSSGSIPQSGTNNFINQ